MIHCSLTIDPEDYFGDAYVFVKNACVARRERFTRMLYWMRLSSVDLWPVIMLVLTL